MILFLRKIAYIYIYNILPWGKVSHLTSRQETTRQSVLCRHKFKPIISSSFSDKVQEGSRSSLWSRSRLWSRSSLWSSIKLKANKSRIDVYRGRSAPAYYTDHDNKLWVSRYIMFLAGEILSQNVTLIRCTHYHTSDCQAINGVMPRDIDYVMLISTCVLCINHTPMHW